MALAQTNALKLVAAFNELKARARHARTLDECMAAEYDKILELRKIYAPKITHARFLRLDYFDAHTRFARHQDIDPRYFLDSPEEHIFVSHRWDQSSHPDPSGRKFALIKERAAAMTPPDLRAQTGVWFDYACVPQRDANGQRSEADEHLFRENLRIMHLLAMLGKTLVLFDRSYLQRSWCCWEWLLSTSISACLWEPDAVYPFGNSMRFRHLAVLILFLSMNDTDRAAFMAGDDRIALAFLNTLVLRTIEDTDATYAEDKNFLFRNLSKHFSRHLQFTGLRTLLASAMHQFEIMQARNPNFGEIAFTQFMILSDDVGLDWTREAMIDMDTIVVGGLEPFAESVFHDREISVTPGAQSRAWPEF